MAKIHFSLVAPERELFAGDVDQVDAPGTEGDFGVLYGHAPFMTTLRPGEVIVRDGAANRIFTIQGGFADITPESFTLLAEHAVEITAAN
ncbi:ATP synthase F1 subunit epsilon [Caulobacter sp. S45]|uniref:ATP synthase F1 subunit epsilon n=1 Tax=Caulobacter sp. S45 TaxID=1641861 RepID=UPI00131B13BD|nr:ATP synthase F1 subunit epsilon [Caulobacter sp. S45]